ncbi:MAG: CrcB family protein [Bacteriovoracaceae bacterium]|jgi:fluoride exporter|nr:CrcB family protein [Bacteriovoracaceae bacterium]
MIQLSFLNLAIIFLGGGFGASLRFLFSRKLNTFSGKIWAGTLFVNLLGCLIFFLLSQYATDSKSEYQMFLKVGLLGSLTTFSTFSFEVVTLFKAGRIYEGLLVLALNIVFGIIIGIWILK